MTHETKTMLLEESMEFLPLVCFFFQIVFNRVMKNENIYR